MENPFVAPDIQDIIRDKKISRRQAITLLAAGVVFVTILLGAYYGIQAWYPTVAPGSVISPVTEELPKVVEVNPESTIEERQASMDALEVPSDVEAAMMQERIDGLSNLEQQAVSQPSIEERQMLMDTQIESGSNIE